MLRFTLLLFVALTALVAAGPTVRKDEVTNAVTSTVDTEMKPAVSQEEPAKEPQAPVKLPVSNDEQENEIPSTVTPTTESTAAPTTTPSRPVTTSTTTTSTTVSITTPTKTPTTPSTSQATKPPRKTITFDQRQEGKYNIRADLENFVIVVVPSGSTSGASLLDLLTRSAQKKELHQTRKASHKRKNNKAHGGQAHHKKAAQVTPEVIVLDENNQRSAQLEAEEFIEGRTPYKVDLSSSARSVDIDEVPMASGRVVRFPGASGNYPQPYGDRATADGAGRALRVGGYQHPNTNTLVVAVPTNNHILPGDGDHQQRDGTNQSPLLLLHRSGDDDNATDKAGTGGHNKLVVHYPLVDHDSHHPSSFDSLVYEPLRSDVDMTQLQLQPDDRYDDLEHSDADTDGLDDGWDELRLLGAQEQCGPDRKRDSYGVCQFVQP